MLYTQTVAPETLELLKRLESEPFMDSFSLAGGTALALYLGHRVSVDLDLFTPESFDEKQLEFSLRHKYGFQTKFTAQHTLKGTIGGVKIDYHVSDEIAPDEDALQKYIHENDLF